jgi:hypothetical protein
MRLMQREVTQLLCMKCGHGISCGVSREGERLGCFLVFFDDQGVSETYGERIAYCPGCAARPDYHLLLLQAAR